MLRSSRLAVAASLSLATAVAAAGGPQAHYADDVIQYDPTFGGGKLPRNRDATRALGKPQLRNNDVSLGSGGLLEVAFVTSVLMNSGDDRPDLQIVEVGRDKEDTLVAVMPADEQTSRAIAHLCQDQLKPLTDGYCELGRAKGGTASLDLDALFPGFRAGELRFNAVQLVDDAEQGGGTGNTAGADIDGVVALHNGPPALWPFAGFAPVVSVPQSPVTTGTPLVRMPAVPGAPVMKMPEMKAVAR